MILVLALVWMLVGCAIFVRGNAVITTTIAADLIPRTKSYSPNKRMGLGIFILPVILYLLTVGVLFICGRCLQVNFTVNFTLMMPKILKTCGFIFSLLCLFSVVVDCVFFAGSYWLSYVFVFVFHGAITGATLYLIRFQEKQIVELGKRALTFHNFLIDFRQVTTKKVSKAHLV